MYITDFLPQLRELNTIYSNVTDSGLLNYKEQCSIADFYHKFEDTTAFDKMALNIILEKDKPTCDLLLSSIKTEIENNIRLYELNKECLNGIDTKKISLSEVNSHDYGIKIQLEATQKYSKELNRVNGSLDSIGFREHSQAEEANLWEEHEYLTKHYKEEQARLNLLYKEQEVCQHETVKYIENQFENTYSLNLVFHKIIIGYISVGESSDEKKTNEQTIITEEQKNTPEERPEIEPDMIFRTKMYDKFLVLESKLINNKYLDTELHWKSVHENGKPDIKKLVTFLVALIDNNYFLPNKDTKIKTFFESRYHITIGQNFERKRREPLTEEYKAVFYDYPF